MGCKVKQAWNPKTKRWVKYKHGSSGFEITGVKKHNPSEPFRGVPIKGMRRRGVR